MLPLVWDKCLPLLTDACERNGNLDTPQNTYELLLKNHKYLWLAVRDHEVLGVVLTSIEQYPLKKVCSIDICTGSDLDEWIGNLPIIEQWAQSNGCQEMFMMARVGYERKLKEFNYQKTHVFLQKDLT